MNGITVAALAVLLAATSLSAQTKTQHETSPFAFVFQADCGMEPVAITGTISGTLTWVSQKNKSTFQSEWGPRGDVRAVGLETGNTYNVVGHTQLRYMTTDDNVTIWGYNDTFKVVGLYEVHYNYTWRLEQVLDENREVISQVFKAEADNFKAVCR